MKINRLPGEFAFKALVNVNGAWVLTEAFFFTMEEAIGFSAECKWPAEVYDDGSIYIPDQEELKG